MRKEYDIVIVGAGVAGLMLAKLLNNSKLNILLIEKRDTIKELANHRYGTFSDTIKKYALEKYVIKTYSHFIFLSAKEKANKKYTNGTLQVVDMNTFARKLNLNCDILLNYNITKVERKNNIISIDNKITTKLIVDCSGDTKTIATKLNLIEDKISTDMFCTAFEMTNCNIPRKALDEFMFMAHLKYSNVGFWFYPYSETTCQIGIADFVSKKIKKPTNQKKDLIKYYKTIHPFNKWLANGDIVETVSKIGPTTQLTSFVDDNFLACGDAAGAGTPIVGEGFRISLEMALSAKQTIDKAFSKNDFSKKTLYQHQQNFKKISKYYKWSTLTRFLILNFFTNKEYDIFTSNLGKLPNKNYFKMLRSEIIFQTISKVINLKLTFNILKNLFTSKNNRGYKIKQNEKI